MYDTRTVVQTNQDTNKVKIITFIIWQVGLCILCVSDEICATSSLIVFFLLILIFTYRINDISE